MQQETSGGKKRSLLQRAVDACKNDRKLTLAAYGGIVLLVIALYAASLATERGKTARAAGIAAEAGSPAGTEALTEQKLAAVLSSIRGAGRVEVMITYATGAELVPAMSTRVDSDSSETSDGEKNSATVRVNEVSEPATVGGSGGNEPIVLYEKQPVVRGVIVVAEGAADIRVKLDLQRAVQAVLDIPLSDIEVFERSGIMGNQEGG